MKLDFSTLAAGNKVLTVLFSRVYRLLFFQDIVSEEKQAIILSHLCAQFDESGWYAPSGDELLEIIGQQFIGAYDPEKEEWNIDFLAELLAGQISSAHECVRFAAWPVRSLRVLGDQNIKE